MSAYTVLCTPTLAFRSAIGIVDCFPNHFSMTDWKWSLSFPPLSSVCIVIASYFPLKNGLTILDPWISYLISNSRAIFAHYQCNSLCMGGIFLWRLVIFAQSVPLIPTVTWLHRPGFSYRSDIPCCSGCLKTIYHAAFEISRLSPWGVMILPYVNPSALKVEFGLLLLVNVLLAVFAVIGSSC